MAVGKSRKQAPHLAEGVCTSTALGPWNENVNIGLVRLAHSCPNLYFLERFMFVQDSEALCHIKLSVLHTQISGFYSTLAMLHVMFSTFSVTLSLKFPSSLPTLQQNWIHFKCMRILRPLFPAWKHWEMWSFWEDFLCVFLAVLVLTL